MKRKSVLIFAGSDPGCGAGLQADIQAVAALGAHPLTVVTALTVQDNDRVFSVHPTSAELVQRQALALMEKIEIDAVKIGIAGDRANAEAIADIIRELKRKRPEMHVVLDPVLASGHGDALSRGSAVDAIAPLLPAATVIAPNLPEAAALCGGETDVDKQAQTLLQSCPNVLIKGGHGTGDQVTNRWFTRDGARSWSWPRLRSGFHGTGCTLASAVAALLAQGQPVGQALESAQAYCHETLLHAYAIAEGQRIPNRCVSFSREST